MSTKDTRPLNHHTPQRAVEAFTEYSDVERERRNNSGEAFDQTLFDEAVDLVTRKLEKLEQEGLA